MRGTKADPRYCVESRRPCQFLHICTENVPWDEEENVQIADWLYLSAGIQNVALDRGEDCYVRFLLGGRHEFELARDSALA